MSWARVCILFLLSGFIFNFCSYAQQTVVSFKVNDAPVIDGRPDDSAWLAAKEFLTYDKVAEIDINLKSVYTDKEIFFLVSFPDQEASVTHRTWFWDSESEMYKSGFDREDVFVFKWNMTAAPVDLSVYADNDYMADIWFWKARRTDPMGYADDRFQVLSYNLIPKSYAVTSRAGRTMHLLRKGDEGDAAYKENIYVEYINDKMSRHVHQEPNGSRADIKAKGLWSEGRWVVEFSRLLDTGNGDDIAFDPKNTYLFGVSRYEIAGRSLEPELEQPLYGSGDVSETLYLRFEK